MQNSGPWSLHGNQGLAPALQSALKVSAFGPEVLLLLSMLLWGTLKKKFSYSSADSRFMEKCGNICPLPGTAEVGKRNVFYRHENRNIDLFCLGFVTLLMITWCLLGLLRGGFLTGRLTAWKMWSSFLTPSIPPSVVHPPHLPFSIPTCEDLSPLSPETSPGSKPVQCKFTVVMKSWRVTISFPIF